MDTQQKTNTWRAWIDMQQPKPSPGGTLHVSGTIMVGDEKVNYQLVRAVPQPISGTELLLEVQPSPSTGKNEFPLKYKEEMQKEGSITSVRILVSGQPDVTIPKIDIVH